VCRSPFFDPFKNKARTKKRHRSDFKKDGKVQAGYAYIIIAPKLAIHSLDELRMTIQKKLTFDEMFDDEVPSQNDSHETNTHSKQTYNKELGRKRLTSSNEATGRHMVQKVDGSAMKRYRPWISEDEMIQGMYDVWKSHADPTLPDSQVWDSARCSYRKAKATWDETKRGKGAQQNYDHSSAPQRMKARHRWEMRFVNEGDVIKRSADNFGLHERQLQRFLNDGRAERINHRIVLHVEKSGRFWLPIELDDNEYDDEPFVHFLSNHFEENNMNSPSSDNTHTIIGIRTLKETSDTKKGPNKKKGPFERGDNDTQGLPLPKKKNPKKEKLKEYAIRAGKSYRTAKREKAKGEIKLIDGLWVEIAIASGPKDKAEGRSELETPTLAAETKTPIEGEIPLQTPQSQPASNPVDPDTDENIDHWFQTMELNEKLKQARPVPHSYDMNQFTDGWMKELILMERRESAIKQTAI
jgi:hypothetical protein